MPNMAQIPTEQVCTSHVLTFASLHKVGTFKGRMCIAYTPYSCQAVRVTCTALPAWHTDGSLGQLQPEWRTLSQMPFHGMPGAEQSASQPGASLQAADAYSTGLARPFSLQPAAPVLPVAYNSLNPQLSGCKPAPYRAYHPGTDPGLSMASLSDDGLRVAEGCLRLLAI